MSAEFGPEVATQSRFSRIADFGRDALDSLGNFTENKLARVAVSVIAVAGVASMVETAGQASDAKKTPAVSCKNFEIGFAGSKISASANCYAGGHKLAGSEMHFSGTGTTMDSDNVACATSEPAPSIKPDPENAAYDRATFRLSVSKTSRHGTFRSTASKMVKIKGDESLLSCGVPGKTVKIPARNVICPVPDSGELKSSEFPPTSHPNDYCGVAPPQGHNACAIVSPFTRDGDWIEAGHLSCQNPTKTCEYEKGKGTNWFGQDLSTYNELTCGNKDQVAFYGISTVELVQPDGTECKAYADGTGVRKFRAGNWQGQLTVTANAINYPTSEADDFTYEYSTTSVNLNDINPTGKPNGCDDFPTVGPFGVRFLPVVGPPTVTPGSHP